MVEALGSQGWASRSRTRFACLSDPCSFYSPWPSHPGDSEGAWKISHFASWCLHSGQLCPYPDVSLCLRDLVPIQSQTNRTRRQWAWWFLRLFLVWEHGVLSTWVHLKAHRENGAQLQHRVSPNTQGSEMTPMSPEGSPVIPPQWRLSHLVFLVSRTFAKGLPIRLCLPRLCTHQAYPGVMETKRPGRWTALLSHWACQLNSSQGTHYSWQHLPLFSFIVLHLL